jgi:hypothetical protein
LDSIRARAREEMTSKLVQVGGGGGGDDETLDKGKKKTYPPYSMCYNRVDCRCYHMDRSVRAHIPLID